MHCLVTQPQGQVTPSQSWVAWGNASSGRSHFKRAIVRCSRSPKSIPANSGLISTDFPTRAAIRSDVSFTRTSVLDITASDGMAANRSPQKTAWRSPGSSSGVSVAPITPAGRRLLSAHGERGRRMCAHRPDGIAAPSSTRFAGVRMRNQVTHTHPHYCPAPTSRVLSRGTRSLVP